MISIVVQCINALHNYACHKQCNPDALHNYAHHKQLIAQQCLQNQCNPNALHNYAHHKQCNSNAWHNYDIISNLIPMHC